MTNIDQTFYGRYGKRLFDLTLCIIAAILLIPVIGVVALIVRIGLGRGVLYKQTRPGLHGKPFVLYKFRTMVDIYDEKGHLLPDKERLTWLGYWLRRLSLDELPQLWNVVKGEASLIGPRPQLLKYVQRCTPEQMRRHDVKPGVTGWAQVNGRNSITWEERFKLDVWYVDNISFLLDLQILFRTIWTVFSQSGISAHGHATMPEFLGTHAHLATAAAGVNGSLTLPAEEILDEAEEENWSESKEIPAHDHRELVTASSDLDSTNELSEPYELMATYDSSRNAVLSAARVDHAEAGLVHGTKLDRHTKNGHTNGHARNGHYVHVVNGVETELSTVPAIHDSSPSRKPR